jgi:hypothetical protein
LLQLRPHGCVLFGSAASCNHTPWLAAKAAGLNVTLSQGCGVNDLDRSKFAEAVAAAAAADVAVLFMGLDFAFESEWGNGPDCQNDRVNLTLPGVQEALIAAIVATGTPVVVVLMNGGAIAVEPWVDTVPALVEAFYPGELGGGRPSFCPTGAQQCLGRAALHHVPRRHCGARLLRE